MASGVNRWLEDLWQDLRFAVRTLSKNPGFTLVALLALTLGSGANTAMFSIVNAVLLRPLPYAHPEQLVQVWSSNPDQGWSEATVSYPSYSDWLKQSTAFEQLAAYSPRDFNYMSEAEPARLKGAVVTANFFKMLKIGALPGRSFLPEEDEPGRNRVVLVSRGLWQKRFGGRLDFLGKTITLDGLGYTVIGIMPVQPGLTHKAELWIPVAPSVAEQQQRTTTFLYVVGRLKRTHTLQQAQTQMDAVAHRLQQQYPDTDSGWQIKLVDLHEQVVGGVKSALLLLSGAASCVLLIACANVANLLLAQAALRQREFSIRAALGASPRRIFRQLLTESVLLAVLGGSLGLLVAGWAVQLLPLALPADLPLTTTIGLDGGVLGFTLAVSVLTGVLFGVVPALQVVRHDLSSVLKEGSRGSTAGRGDRSLRSSLVVCEVALSLVLLSASGLFLRSFQNLQSAPLGFNPQRVLTLNVALTESRYREKGQQRAFFEQILERIATLPGVVSIGATSVLPFSGSSYGLSFVIEGRPALPTGQFLAANYSAVSPGYFQTMAVALKHGRLIDRSDSSTTVRTAVINQTLARRFFDKESPLGRRLALGGQQQAEWLTIVGVVADVKHVKLDEKPEPEIFVPLLQHPEAKLTLAVRSTGEPGQIAPSVRTAVYSVDRLQPVADVKTMEQRLGESIAQPRINLYLLGLFAALALALAMVGLYGVMSYFVTQRTHEIGIRMALGATPANIFKLVLDQGLRLVLIGVAAGAMLTFMSTKILAGFLFEIKTSAPLTFLSVSLLLVCVALVATYLPARRAMQAEPLDALNQR